MALRRLGLGDKERRLLLLWRPTSLREVLGGICLIHSVQDHVLLDFIDLLQLLWEMLVRLLVREEGLEVHLGLLLEEVSGDHAVHREPLPVATPMLLHTLTRKWLEVFKLHPPGKAS